MAAQIEAALIHQLSSGETTGIRKRAPILRDYAKDFLAYVEKTRLSDKTKLYYRNGWRLMEDQDIAGMQIDKITRSSAHVLQISGSGSNVNCALRTLHRMLSIAEERNLILRVPRFDMAEEVGRDKVITGEEEAVILAKASRTLRDAYLLIADMGVRPADAASLLWVHVDFNSDQVFVQGGKTGKKAARWIPMSDRVRAMMLRRSRLNKVWVFGSTSPRRAGKHILPGSISGQFSKFKIKNGLPENLVLYSARHTFATDLTEATGNLTKTQKALGHTSLATTARYNHTRSAEIATIINHRNAERHNLGHSSQTIQ